MNTQQHLTSQREPTKLLHGISVTLHRNLTAISIALLASVAQAAERTAETAVTPVYPVFQHDVFLARIKEGPIGLLFIGDSIMAGWPSHKNTWQKFEPYHPANFGISGETTERVLWRMLNGELDGINPNPKAAVILIGTNNIGHSPEEQPEWTAAGIKKIVETVRAKLPSSKVLLVGVFPRGVTQEQGGATAVEKVAKINAIIKQLDDGKHVTFLDLASQFTDAQGNANRELLGDGLHPNDKGYEIWFNAMWPLLEKMLK